MTTSLIQKRLIDSSLLIDDSEEELPIVFQHAIFCQTCLPYRDPKTELRWERVNGNSRLIVSAGDVYNPKTEQLENVGLPYGPKARLLFNYINTEAVQNQEPRIDVEKSLTSFVKRLNLDPKGRNINTVRNQLLRINACRMTIVLANDSVFFQHDQKVIRNFSFWISKDSEKQKSLFERYIELDHDYFDQLMQHAVPLDERALVALSNSAMGLDVYQWLAHRLHRVKKPNGEFIAWANIKDQFGVGYNGAMSQFRRNFLPVLKTVHGLYPAAKFTTDARGMKLFNSPPPVSKKLVVVR